MRKFLIALAAVAVASCSTELTIDAPKGAVIEFGNHFVNNSTRAAVDITKDTIDDFGVFGWVEADEKQGLIFNNTLVYKQDGKFIYQTPQYWIGGAQYYFAALAPKEAAWKYSPLNAQNGTISFNNAVAGAEQDLLFDFVAPERTPESITSKPGEVSFNFHHILSRVKFSFKNGFASTSNITLKVTDVVITNAHARGTLDLNNGQLAAAWNAVDTMEADFGDTTVENNAENIMDSGATAVSPHLYLIPAKATYNVRFNVTLYQAGVELAHYNRLATITLDMERGKSYEFKATLDQNNTADHGALNPIEFIVGNVGSWNPNN